MGREERIEMLKKEISKVNTYNRPTYCEKCGGVMVFKGVGEYECEKCGALEYDDYGKVRNYIEKHMGANAAQASKATGVSQKAIREMLKEARLEIAGRLTENYYQKINELDGLMGNLAQNREEIDREIQKCHRQIGELSGYEDFVEGWL